MGINNRKLLYVFDICDRLDDSMRAVVADFGLSRDIYESQYYSSNDKQAKLPIKWMAPESLEKSIYNSRTDVVRASSSLLVLNLAMLSQSCVDFSGLMGLFCGS